MKDEMNMMNHNNEDQEILQLLEMLSQLPEAPVPAFFLLLYLIIRKRIWSRSAPFAERHARLF